MEYRRSPVRMQVVLGEEGLAYSKVLVHDRASLKVGVVEVDDAAGFAPAKRIVSTRACSVDISTHAVIRMTSFSSWISVYCP